MAQALQTEYSVQEKIRETYTRSDIELTKNIGRFGRWPYPALKKRGKALAKLAADTWTVTNPLYA